MEENKEQKEYVIPENVNPAMFSHMGNTWLILLIMLLALPNDLTTNVTDSTEVVESKRKLRDTIRKVLDSLDKTEEHYAEWQKLIEEKRNKGENLTSEELQKLIESTRPDCLKK